MSVDQGNLALYSDMQYWYNTLNTILTNYGGSLGTLSVPTQDKIDASDINTLKTKIDAMKQDEYLGSVSSMYTTYNVVNQGTLITATTSSQYNTLINNLKNTIKCRNLATNSNTTKSHGKNSHTDKTNSTYSHGSNWNENNPNGIQSQGVNGASVYFWNGVCENGRKENGYDSNGQNQHTTQQHLKNSHGTVINITCANTTHSNE